MRRISVCAGCCKPIQDQFILRVAPDLEWHAKCLKCADCLQFLDENCTCFVRDSKTYCRLCYIRLYGTKCFRCGEIFKKNDFVMRARHRIYHTDCFRCMACDRHLVPGDEFAIKDNDGLLCKFDFEISENLFEMGSCDGVVRKKKFDVSDDEEFHTTVLGQANFDRFDDENHDSGDKKRKLNISEDEDIQLGEDTQQLNPGSGGGSSNSSTSSESSFRPAKSNTPTFKREGRSSKSDGKATRVRTVLTEKQLHTLRTCYSANPRPDALMKEQLVEMTGLSPRVIRVWFQNKRCKDKKRSLIMKQMHQHDKGSQDAHRLNLSTLHAIPLVASSPVSHESSISGLQAIEIQSYQLPWKTLSDFAMQNDLDRLETPHFRHILNQIHGYSNTDVMRPPLSDLHPTYDGLQNPGSLSEHTSHFPNIPSELSSPSSV